MARPRAKAPARQYHISGQSVVRIGGDDFYLGKHDSAELIARYGALISVYQQNGLTLPDGFDVSSLDPQVAILTGAAPILATHQADQSGRQPGVLIESFASQSWENIMAGSLNNSRTTVAGWFAISCRGVLV